MLNLPEHARSQLDQLREAVFCKVCKDSSEPFDVVDLNKTCNTNIYPKGLSGIPVLYRRCTACGFIFTNFFDNFTDDQWQSIIYNDEYAEVDPDYKFRRPHINAKEIRCLLPGRQRTTIGVDYGGGNGLTVDILRSYGWKFDCVDPFGRNDVSERRGTYNFCSAFEVFEHLPDPFFGLSQIMELASPDQFMLLIGTAINDGSVDLGSRLNWSYAAPRNGHISLHSRKSLGILAKHYNLKYSSVSKGTHLMTRNISERTGRAMLLRSKALLKVSNLLRLP